MPARYQRACGSRTPNLDVGLGAQRFHPLIVLLALLHLGHDLRQLVADLVELVVALRLPLLDLEDVETGGILEHGGDPADLDGLEARANAGLERGHRHESEISVVALLALVPAVAASQRA